jgi:hypothetical protein
VFSPHFPIVFHGFFPAKFDLCQALSNFEHRPLRESQEHYAFLGAAGGANGRMDIIKSWDNDG